MRNLLLFSLLLAGAAGAQTRYVWNGSSGNWTDADRWTPAGIPAASDTAEINAGVVFLVAPTTVAGLDLPGLGAVNGDHDLTITAAMRWTGGGAGFKAFRGTGTVAVGPDATLRMDGPGATMRYGVTSGRTFVNQGNAEWTGVGRWDDTGRFVNEGTLTIPQSYTEPVTLCFSSVPDAMTNGPTGVLVRTGTGEAVLACGFNNDGAVRVETGSLNLRGFNTIGGTDSGSYVVQVGATLLFSGGIRTISETGSISGGGAVEIRNGSNPLVSIAGTYAPVETRLIGGRLNVDGVASVPLLSISEFAGALGGSGTLTVTDVLAWSNGRMDGTGTTVLGPVAAVRLSGPTLRLDGTRTLRLEGATAWPAGTSFAIGTFEARLVNAGTLSLVGEGTRSLGFGIVRNEGELIHSAGTTTLGSGFDNAGVVRIEGGVLRLTGTNATGGTDTGRYALDGADGRLEFAGGARTLEASAVVDGIGTVAFTGGTLASAATWRPGASPGMLRVESPANRPFRVETGTLDMEIGGADPGSGHDQIAVQNNAVLGGTLRVRFVNGFVPALGSRFALVTCGGVCSGSFATLDLPAGLEAYVEVRPEAATLVVGPPVSADAPALPTTLALHAPTPNPSSRAATVRVDLPEPGRIRLAVLDALGREVAVLLDAERPAGAHAAPLDASRLAPGVYVVRLDSPGGVLTRRLTVAR